MRTVPVPWTPLRGHDLCWSGKMDNPEMLWNQGVLEQLVVDLCIYMQVIIQRFAFRLHLQNRVPASNTVLQRFEVIGS